MPKPKPPYPSEFRARVVDLARSGRTRKSLAREFGVTDTTIRNWLRQADLDQGRRHDGLTSEEKQELTRLRRENATGRRPHGRTRPGVP
jgi:transposase